MRGAKLTVDVKTNDIHYQACFSTRHREKPEETWTILVKTIRSWMRDRGPKGAAIDQSWFFRYGRWSDAANPQVFVETARTDGNGTPEAPEYWAVRMQKLDSKYLMRYWRTDVGVVARPGQDVLVTVTVTTHIRSGYIGEEPENASFSSPALITKLLGEAWFPHAGSLPLHLRPYEYSEEDVPHILELLSSKERTSPMVLLSRENTHGFPLLNAFGLTTKIAGAAAVFQSRDGYAESALLQKIPRPYRTVDGMVRVYMPGLDFDRRGDEKRHRYYSRVDIEERGDSQVATEIIRALSRRIDLTRSDAIFNLEDVREKFRRQRLKQLSESQTEGVKTEWVELLEQENENLSKRLRESEEALDDAWRNQQQSEEIADVYRHDATKARTALSEISAAMEVVETLKCLPQTVNECLSMVCLLHPGKVTFTEKAIRSSKNASINVLKQEMPAVWSLLWSMATDLHRLIFVERLDRASLPVAYKELSTFDLALSEGTQTRNDKKLMALREFEFEGKERSMEPHVKLGNKEPKCLRVHFSVDGEKERLIIGHCGDHLDTYSTRKRS